MSTVGRGMSGAAGMVIAVALLLGSTADAAPAAGQRQGPCADDVAKFCKDVQPGGGRMAQCLKQHEQDLSPACKQHVSDVKKRGQEYRAACEDDVLRLCADVQPGSGRMAACLKQHEQELTPDCKAKISTAFEAIREVDDETPILVSVQGWGAVRWLPALEPVDDPHTVYMVHQYEPQEMYTHQSPEGGNGYPGEFDVDYDGAADRFDRAWLEGMLSPVRAFQATHGRPVSVNEFGAERWVPDAAQFMDDQMGLFEELGMNHMLWAWDPAWEPWTSSSNGFNFLFGPDPDNVAPVDNDLMSVITRYWSRNTFRPSSFAAQD